MSLNYRNKLFGRQLFFFVTEFALKGKKLKEDILVAFDQEKCGLGNGVLLSGYRWENIEKSILIFNQNVRTVYSNVRAVYPNKNHVTTHPGNKQMTI